jgi:hypothetical protein
MEPEKGSPEHPVPTIQYPSAEAVHPNREDYEEMRKAQRAMQYGEPKPLKRKIADALEWIIRKNNSIRFSSLLWLVIFFGWWMAMVTVNLWLVISLNAVYDQTHSTFDVSNITFLINLAGFMTVIVFPAYALCYAVLAIIETVQRRRKYRKALELQAKFGG